MLFLLSMFKSSEIFHKIVFKEELQKPNKFTFPFRYEPHPWVVQACNEVQEYLTTQTDFQYNFGFNNCPNSLGKMFGVLIVENNKDEIGYLSAFSGKIDERNQLKGFVPAIFDLLNPNGFFKQGEREINQVNREIITLENSTEFISVTQKLSQSENDYLVQLKKLSTRNKEAKKKRKEKRNALLGLNNEENNKALLSLENESKKQHYELKDFKRRRKANLQKIQDELNVIVSKIEELKALRKEKSAQLQKQIHNSFVFLNAKHETKDINQIFEPFERIPPSGAGECAAPRMLQYAFQNNLKPLAMGEFWWGASPDSEIREHKLYYPACKSKCEPILTFMLQGLNVNENPVLKQPLDFDLDIIYEDDYILAVNKPNGILSVSGKKLKESLQTKVQTYLNKEALLVHRLDMATSGLVLVAKNMEIYKNLQRQFTDRTVKKMYTAILDGELRHKNGEINLPLRVDLDNRPMQLVCYEHGKDALTFYQVVEIKDKKTRILFYPYTGRTHQLRVHSAHKKGLHIPILGDVLYGTKSGRLHLHATTLEFSHPISQKIMKLESKSPF